MRFSKSIAFISLLMVTTIAQAEIKLTVTPAALDFGSLAVGSTSSLNATAGFTFDGVGAGNGNANNGTVTTVSIVNPVGGTFVASQNCVGTRFSAAFLGASCVVQVSCTPGAVGNITADLEVRLQLDTGAQPDVQTTALSCAGVTAPPGPGPGATAIPTMGVLGLGILSLLLTVCGIFGVRGTKRK